MRRLIKTTSFLILMTGVLLIGGQAWAGELSPALAALMNQNPDNEPLTVLVFLHGGVDIQHLDQQLHQQKALLAVRHQTVIESLRSAADANQFRLLEELTSRKTRGEVQSFRPYWIVNAIRLKATEDVIKEIADRADVDVIEPNIRPQLIEPVSRGGGEKVKLDHRGIGITPGLVNIGVRRVWEELGIRGEGALIGSLDTGVDVNHPSLAGRWRGNHAPWQECWLDVVYDTYEVPTDVDGHGTHCTGTMTGLAEDDTIGVAPAAEWIAANVIDHPISEPDFDPDVIACFEWFADPDGNPLTMDDVPDVVQNSWGVHEGMGYPDCDSRWWDAIDACEAAGPVIVFAAGNEGDWPSSLRSPSDRATTLTNVFSVGATYHSPPFEIAPFSSRGPAGVDCGPAENLIKPEVSAPGVNIYSAEPGGGYVELDGTSMATPHVCGVVALMRSANPDLDAITIKEVLMGTAVDLGAEGEDNDYGHGFIDAYAAVSQVMSGFGWVEGFVTDAVTGDPMTDVHVQGLGGYWHATTDEMGFYSIRIPAGPQTVQAVAYSYEDLNQPVMVPENDTLVQNLSLTLAQRMTISGTVYLPGGNPVDGGTPAAGAALTILDIPESAVLADASGQFSLSLPVGFDYQLSVTSGLDGYLNQTVPFDQDLELDFYLNQGNADGFESGDLTGFGWIQAGAADWIVQGEEVHSGEYAARAGTVGDGQYSQMFSYVNCGDGGEVSLWLKVSSEEGDDFLRLQINNEVVGEWSGEIDWTQISFPVDSGTQVFRARYYKGSSGSSGADTAWLDDLIFPGGADHTAKIVTAPEEVAVGMDAQTQVTRPGFIFNMGLLDLTWSASESADWLAIAPTEGTLAPGTYQQLDFTFDAVGLLDGQYTTQVTLDSNDAANPVYSYPVRLNLDTVISPVGEALPAHPVILGAVPNPFNPTTTLHFSLPHSERVKLSVYDVRGRLVKELKDEFMTAGWHEATWDGRDSRGRGVASGTYFARLKGRTHTHVKTMTLVR